MSDKPEVRKMEFVFTRIHFEGLFSSGANKKIKDFLKKSEGKFVEKGRFKWAFGDIGCQNINSTEILFGRLGKTITEKFEIVYDQQNRSYNRELIKSNEAVYSNFFIMPDFNVLAFEEKHNLKKGPFIEIFKEFWIKYDVAEIYFEFLKDEIEIFELIKTWDSITEASFDLVPSNPSSKETWKPVDEMLYKAKAKKAKLKFENKEDSLSKENSIIQQSMSMAADGYGEFKLKGLKDNVGQNFNSISKIIKKEIHSVDDLIAIVSQIYEEIKKIVQSKKQNGQN